MVAAHKENIVVEKIETVKDDILLEALRCLRIAMEQNRLPAVDLSCRVLVLLTSPPIFMFKTEGE